MSKLNKEEEVEKSRLQGLQERLYSQNNPTIFKDRRSTIHNSDNAVRSEWAELPVDQEILEINTQAQKSKVFSKFSHTIFYGAFFIFLVAVAFSGYQFIWGANTISENKIIVSVDAPSFINGGQVFPVDIYINNQNKVALEKVDLIIEYPKGEKITSQEEADLKRVPLGTVGPGDTVKGTADIVLYGRENNIRDIKISVEYYSGGTSVVRKKDVVHSLTLKAAPVILTTSSFKEIASNQELTYTTSIRAERGIDLENFLLRIEYPNGFQFVSSQPQPRFGNNTWTFDKIEKGQTVNVVVKGIVRGEDGDEKVFRVAGGLPDRADTSQLGIVYADTKSSVVVQKPFIGLKGAFEAPTNSATGDFALRAGERVSGYFEYQNNIGDTISNVSVTAQLSGEILDRRRVTVSGGYYDSARNTIVWDRTTMPALATLVPGQKGVLKFFVQSFPLSAKQNGYFSQPQITVEAKVKGSRLSDISVPEQIAASTPLVGKIITETGVRAEVLGADAPSSNSTPATPQVEKTTSYTLAIGLLNRSNTLSDASISFVLPPNVTYTGKFEPLSENISYNSTTRTLTWLPQVIVPDTGFGKPQKKVYIGLTVKPSIGDIGSKPTLTDQIEFSAKDSYTGTQINSTTGTVQVPLITQ